MSLEYRHREANLDFTSFFENLTEHLPHDYQRRVAAFLLGRSTAVESGLATDIKQSEKRGIELSEEGRNVVICAPTGSGKTWAAIAPFVFSRALGKPIADRLLYVLPLRSIAEDLNDNIKGALKRSGLFDACPVRLQTGETTGIPQIGDPTFSEGRIIFCTVDQLLSSYLNIPFSLPPRQANINAGALVGALIVFDEFHLMDPDRSLKTAMLLTNHLRGFARFVWMSATQAEAARKRLLTKDRLDALSVELEGVELQKIPSQRDKKRTWLWSRQPVTAHAVWRQHQDLPEGKRRTLVIVNTVARAQQLYRDLKQLIPDSAWSDVLHSRFLAEHRSYKTIDIRARFTKGSTDEALLVATQVVEAGLDISAVALHTELAPANALVQRAGRCARFAKEEGIVRVYDTTFEKGVRSYVPYGGRAKEDTSDSLAPGSTTQINTLIQAMDRTASELERCSGQQLSFLDELTLIDSVHTALDLRAINSFDALEWRRKAAQAMTPTSDHSNYALAGDLIRDIDNVSICLASEDRLCDSNARLDPEYMPACISVSRRSVAAMSAMSMELASVGTWSIKAAVYDQRERVNPFRGYETVASVGQTFGKWVTATYRGSPLVLNPSLARYSREFGLELGVASGATDWQSSGSLTEEDLAMKARPDYRYRAETFQEHIAWVRLHAQLLCGDEAARSKLAIHWKRNGELQENVDWTDHSVGLQRCDELLRLPAGLSAGLAVLSAVLHDTGKLTTAWQNAVWNWQELKGSRREHYPAGAASDRRFENAQRLLRMKRNGEAVLLAHSDYDRKWVWLDGRPESDVERGFSRPNHALESAWLSLPIIAAYVDYTNAEQLAKAVLSAIARHHTPAAGLGRVDRTEMVPAFSLAFGAADVIQAIEGEAALQTEQPTHLQWEDFLKMYIRSEFRPKTLAPDEADDWRFWPLMMLCARIVRLADQRGTQVGATT